MNKILGLILINALSTIVQAGETVNRSKIPAAVEKAIRVAYLKEAVKQDNPWHTKRLQLIQKAKEECGGRYEHRELMVLAFETNEMHDKIFAPQNAAGDRELTGYSYEVSEKYALVERIFCSVHGGAAASTINAVKLKVAYTYNINVADFEAEDPIARNVEIKADSVAQIPSREYKTPYDAE